MFVYILISVWLMKICVLCLMGFYFNLGGYPRISKLLFEFRWVVPDLKNVIMGLLRSFALMMFIMRC